MPQQAAFKGKDLFFDLPDDTTSVFVMVEGEESAFLTLNATAPSGVQSVSCAMKTTVQ